MPATRAADLTTLGTTTFDLLIIGGGITGAGVARDAAMRGLRVALVEQNDFASGTSSRSSRLVHGGVRYLEHGALRLVFEASRERRILLQIAPHLVRPLGFTWPVYRGARVAQWKLAAALTLYDALALFRNVARHTRLSRADVLAREPMLRSAELRGGALYWDAATDDVRLTLSNMRSALEVGALVVNHARVSALLSQAGRVTGATVTDELGGETTEVTARVVLNATGPWSDHVERLAHPTAESGVRGSKGAHLLVSRARIRNEGALTLIAPEDGRVTFVLPAGDFTLIGTTESFDNVNPADVHADENDVSYLLGVANYYFPGASLLRSDVVSAWAGLRPLAAVGSGEDAGSASREHAIAISAPGLIRVTGGKLTAYRSMAEEIVDLIQRELGRSVTQCSTADVPLSGGASFDLAREHAAARAATRDDAVAERLVHAHGTAWREVWSLAERDPKLGARVSATRPYLLAELRYGIEMELACTLGDLLIRRTPLAFELHDNGRAAARTLAPFVAEWLSWDVAAIDAAIAGFDAEVTKMFGPYLSSFDGP